MALPQDNSGVKLNAAHPLNQGVQGSWWFEIDGYREEWIDDAQQATRVFNVAWSVKDSFVSYALGNSRKGNPDLLSNLSRDVPWQLPSRPWLYAVKCDLISGVGVPATSPKPDDLGMVYYLNKSNNRTDIPGFAKIAVTFRALDYDVKDDFEVAGKANSELGRFVSRYAAYAVENFQMPGASFAWVNAPNDPLQSGPVKIFPTINLIYKWWRVPAVPWAAIDSCLGRVNQFTFDQDYGPSVGWKASDPETLLCMAPDIFRYRSGTGALLYDISYKFNMRPSTWNLFFRYGSVLPRGFYTPQAPAGFEPIGGLLSINSKLVLDKSIKPYETADFDTLFRLP